MSHHDDQPRDPQAAAEFYATLLGGRISTDPPRPDSMLAWLLAHPGSTSADIAAERARRGEPPVNPDDVLIYDSRHPERCVWPASDEAQRRPET